MPRPLLGTPSDGQLNVQGAHWKVAGMQRAKAIGRRSWPPFPQDASWLAPWLPRYLAAWLLGCLAIWLPGCLAAWLPACLPGCLAAYIDTANVARSWHASLDPLYCCIFHGRNGKTHTIGKVDVGFAPMNLQQRCRALIVDTRLMVYRCTRAPWENAGACRHDLSPNG